MKLITGKDLDNDALATNLRSLADALDDGTVHTSCVETKQRAPGDDHAEFELNITYALHQGEEPLATPMEFGDEHGEDFLLYEDE